MGEIAKVKIGPEMALQQWEDRSRKWFADRLPNISFTFDDTNSWNIDKKLSARIGFDPALEDLKTKDDTFIRVLRCAIVEAWKAPKARRVRGAKPFPIGVASSMQNCLRRFKEVQVRSVYELRSEHLDEIQKSLIRTGGSAQKLILDSLEDLARFLRLSGVCPKLFWEKDSQASSLLSSQRSKGGKRAGDPYFNSDAGETDGDRRIGALMELAHLTLSKREDLTNDALLQLERLTQMDHICIYTMLVLLCAPARINEVLCMSLTDTKTFQSFAAWEKAPVGHNSSSRDMARGLYRAHQTLFYRNISSEDLDEYSRSIVFHKGSKGGKWAPKAVLVWMQAVLQECVSRIEENSKRSRKLAAHYEQNPDLLYLPKWAEYLREKEWWSHNEILGVWGDLAEKPREDIPCADVLPGFHPSSVNLYLKEAGVERKLWTECPKKGVKPFVFRGAQIIEAMLRTVKVSMNGAKSVTNAIAISCKVSERLFLTDCSAVLPFALASINSQTLSQRFGLNAKFSIFKKTGIKIYQKGNLVDAFIGTHDARHFICDHATKADISDVLVNKWCRRADIRQMDFYEQYDPFGKARRAASMGVSYLEKEFAAEEISENFQRKQELKIGGTPTIWLRVADKKIQVASVDEVINAGASPVLARAGNGEPLMMNPVLTGICSHQHHITPCQNYDVFCLGCSDHTLVKGHLPTNDEAIRLRSVQRKLLIDYIEEIIPSLNAGTVEHSGSMAKHLEIVFALQINRRQISAEVLAEELIERVDEDILNRIQSTALRDLLRKAFVCDRIGDFIEDKKVGVGSTITYNDGIRSGSMNINLIFNETGGQEDLNMMKERIESEFGEGCIDSLVDHNLLSIPYELESDEDL